MFKLKSLAVGLTFMLLAAVIAMPADLLFAAPAAQEETAITPVRAMEVTGTLNGVQGENFDKIWLALTPNSPSTQVTLVVDFDRNAPLANGLGFWILNENQLQRVINGAALSENSISGGNRIDGGQANQLAATLNNPGTTDLTLVLYNDSPADANFTARVEGAMISDSSGRVRDPNAPAPRPETEDATEAVTDTVAITDTAVATDTDAAAVPAATTAVTTTAVATTTATTTATAAMESMDDDMMMDSSMLGADGVVRTETLEGILPNQFDTHYLGLEPSERDAQINLTMAIQPADNGSLVDRLNFFVLDQAGFGQFLSGERLSEVALSAGNVTENGPANERQASFRASGLGAYTVLVVNNASVLGQYTLTADGGVLLDDSGQTVTAQEAMSATLTMVDTDVMTDTATVDEADDTDATAGTTAAPAAAAPVAATPARTITAQPGGTYTIRAGDSLSIVARDVYGDLNLYTSLCEFNNIANCNVVEVGDVIQLPTRAQLQSGATAPAAPATTAPADDTADDTADDAADEIDDADVDTSTELTDTIAITETSAISIIDAISDLGTVTETETMTDTEETP